MLADPWHSAPGTPGNCGPHFENHWVNVLLDETSYVLLTGSWFQVVILCFLFSFKSWWLFACNFLSNTPVVYKKKNWSFFSKFIHINSSYSIDDSVIVNKIASPLTNVVHNLMENCCEYFYFKDALQAVTRTAIQEARLKDVRQEIFNSDKLKVRS